MTKNYVFTAEITGYSSEGMGVCRTDGQTVFVRGAARGDICDIRVLKVNAKAAWGKIERLITPSPHRTDNDCAVFPMCGGCDFRHISYNEELELKRARAEQTLKRIGGVDLPVERIIAADRTEGYRNKAIIPIGISEGRVITGYYRARSHDIIPCENCKINAPEINICAEVTREFLERFGIGGAKHLMVRATSGGVQAAMVTDGSELNNAGIWADMLHEKCADIKSILVINNTRNDNVLLSGEIKTVWGELTLTEELGGLEFELHPFAFAQVNSKQAVELYDTAIEFAAPKAEDTAADLYCGTGTLTLWLARRAKMVYGVEAQPNAVECAKRNAKKNGIYNADFILSDTGRAVLPEKPQAAVIDPPRSGLDAAAVDMITALEPERLVYVSCDPATLARDVKLLGNRGYGAARCAAVDMFPRTRHVEMVVLLTKLKST